MIQSIMRLLPEPPSFIKKGSIVFNGEELVGKTEVQMRKHRGNSFAMIFQDSMTALNPTMRVGNQIVEAMRVHKKISKREAKFSAIETMLKVGLPNPEHIFKAYSHTLSGGMRQRVMIAMALCCNPEILFADEPTTALDVTTQAQILDLMLEIKEKLKSSLVLITHDLGVVAKMADRLAVMYAGQIVEEGTKEDIYYNHKHPYTWGLLGSMPNLVQTRKGKLISITGTPPDLFSPPLGCSFAPRCKYAMNICFKEMPLPQYFRREHRVRCWLYHDECPTLVTPPIRNKKDSYFLEEVGYDEQKLVRSEKCFENIQD
jgi:oligopeptide transport system ATP-binding protein